MKKGLLALILTGGSLLNVSADTADSSIYKPEIHGVIRTRWEGEWNSADGFASRFEVRNARINIGGKIFPTVNYFVQIDASDQGKMKFLDAWARWQFLPGFRVQAGQFRVPFGVDCFKAPGDYYFPNRSFIGKQMVNMRQVGVKVGYYGTGIPVDIEGGVFNTASIGNHDVWQKSYTYACKVVWRISNVSVSGGFVSYKPDLFRINVTDGTITWKSGRWVAEGEYQYKRYAGNRFKPVNAWNLYGVYTVPFSRRPFNYMSFEGRFDGMTDHSTGTVDENCVLLTDHPERKRATIGATIGRINKAVKIEFSVNYEKYFYNSGVIPTRGDDDKILAEIILKF